MSQNNIVKLAYDQGVQQALADFGLRKLAYDELTDDDMDLIIRSSAGVQGGMLGGVGGALLGGKGRRGRGALLGALVVGAANAARQNPYANWETALEQIPD